MLESSTMAKGLVLAFVVVALSIGLMESGFLTHKEYPILKTKDGLVKGYSAISRDGRTYYGFVGIPYATVGLRFDAPVPSKPWKGIRDATQLPKNCYQFDAMVEGRFEGDELNCLQLNVFTTNPNASRSVLFWIHGGGFISGGSKIYGPKYFMDHDVVVVTMNYRLGALGFLNTGDSLIRGNMGLKDQNLALRWVNKNIDKFGGNPKKITIFGESAGAASVHYHIVSPASKGLFKNSIMLSGAFTNPWSFTNNPQKQAFRLGEKTNCSTTDTTSLVSCLRKLSLQELFKPVVETMSISPANNQEDMFVPSVEAITQEDTFLSQNPRLLLEEGKFSNVNVLMGVTSGLEINENMLNSIDEKWNEYIPTLQHFDPLRTDISRLIREKYFSNKQFLSDKGGFLRNFTQMMSDGLFYQGVHKAAKLHSKVAPVYLYYYDYKSSLPSLYSLFKAVKPTDKLHAKLKVAFSILEDYFKYIMGYPGPHEYGPCHADDLIQLWNVEWAFEIGKRSNDYIFSKTFVKTLVDFANDEKPLQFNGITWPNIDSTKSDIFQCMKIDKEGKIIEEPYGKIIPFWDSLNIRDPKETNNF